MNERRPQSSAGRMKNEPENRIMRVGLFIPCYVDQFYPQVGNAGTAAGKSAMGNRGTPAGEIRDKIYDADKKAGQ
jgi:hypothetical protein